jgi:hypothetical protein
MGLRVLYTQFFNSSEPMNCPSAITILVKPNLRWLVRGYDGSYAPSFY